MIRHSKTSSFALNLLPFAGIAFLWFIAVVRNRLGALEDRFFATGLLGKRTVIHCNDLHTAALVGGLIRVLIHASGFLTQSGAYTLGRNNERVRNQDGWRFHVFHFNDRATNLDRSTLDCIARLCLGAALVLSIGIIRWIPLVFPIWVLFISVAIICETPLS